MQITGSCDLAKDDGEGPHSPFLTPQHTSPTFTSQDSMDVYHDAYASLHRARLNSIGERKRHASLGTTPIGENSIVELDPVICTSDTADILPKNGMVGRVRHASTSAVSQFGSPYHLGRLSLSLSTTSIKRKAEASQRKVASLQKIGELSNGNHYIEVDEPIERDRRVRRGPDRNEPVLREYSEKPVKEPTWMKNYVPAIETDMMLGRMNGHQELQLVPGAIQQPPDTVVQMYTFGPVQRRRVGLQQVREEFKVENFRLHHNAPHLFVSSQWQQLNRMSCLYLGYRLFWAMYFSMWAVWAWVGSMGYDAPLNMKGYYMAYMTNWGIWTLALDTTIQAINVVLHIKKISEDGDVTYHSMGRLMKISWVLSNITGAVHLFITAAYWITVYPNRGDEKLTEIGINTHIIPGIYTFIDVAVSGTPRRLLHAYHPALFITIYTIFNLVYYLCGGLDYQGRTALYPVMDWTRPGSTVCIMSTVIMGLIPALHAIVCALYAARVKAWRVLKISRYVREEDETDQVDEAEEQKV